MQILALFLVSMIEEDATLMFETINDDIKTNDENILYTVDLPEPSPAASNDFSEISSYGLFNYEFDLNDILQKLNHVFASKDEHEENIILKHKLAFVLRSYYELAAEYSFLCQMFLILCGTILICSCVKRNRIVKEKPKLVEELKI